MKYITALLVALVAFVGMAAAEEYHIDENFQSASNGVSVYIGGGSNGYYYPYDYYYPYGGAGFTEVFQSPITISQSITQVQVVGGADGADGQNGADGQPGADGQSGDNVPADDTTEQTPVAAPVYSGPVSANGMQILDNGPSLARAQLELETPVEYVFYGDYNVLVVETRGLSNDTMVKFAQSAIAQEGFKAVYYVQGVIVFADGTVKNEKLDLSTPPRVARSLGYL